MVLDIKNLCVWCNNDTAVGSGRYINRIPVRTDTSTIEWLSEDEQKKYEFIIGYGCELCYMGERD